MPKPVRTKVWPLHAKPTTIDPMKKPKHYAIHPVCRLFPPLRKEELEELAEDIRQNGLLHDIVLYEGKILDGRNRYLACPMAGVKPRFAQWDGTGSPLEWVISENLVRRHLTSSQRAVIAHDILPLLTKEARKRQTLGKKLPKVSSNGKGKASQVAARITKTNRTYVQAIKCVDAQAPELLDSIRSGILRVPEAMSLTKMPPGERKQVLRLCDGKPITAQELRDITRRVKNNVRHRAARAFARSGKSASNQNVLIGDMELLEKRLENDSVDLFLTDPPYAEPSLYGRLAELASVKLKPSGLCLAYAGQFHLSTVMEEMGRHLKYWWMFAIQFSGQHCAIHPRRVQNKWKPIIVFAKPPLRKSPNWLSDLLQGGGRDKEHHHWGQDESEVEYLIQRLTEPGQLWWTRSLAAGRYRRLPRGRGEVARHRIGSEHGTGGTEEVGGNSVDETDGMRGGCSVQSEATGKTPSRPDRLPCCHRRPSLLVRLLLVRQRTLDPPKHLRVAKRRGILPSQFLDLLHDPLDHPLAGAAE